MTFVLIGQIIAAILLVILIIPQGKGGGLGSAFGSSTYHTRRGLEKGIFSATVVTAIVFVIFAFISLINA
jgi:preprotein translocase subunit SecG